MFIEGSYNLKLHNFSVKYFRRSLILRLAFLDIY